MKHKNKNVIVKRTTGKGLGLYANEDIQKGEYIISYIGELITHEEADRRAHTKYLFELNDTHTIDGKGRENTARYMNHSCKPNVEAEIDEHEQINFHALRGIKKGEELCFDYGKEYFDEFIKPIGCRCDACANI